MKVGLKEVGSGIWRVPVRDPVFLQILTKGKDAVHNR